MKKVVIAALIIAAGFGGASFALLSNKTQWQDETSQTTPMSTLPPAEEQTQPAAEPSPQVSTIKYNDSGFEPKEITVTKGTKVAFVNNTDIPLWTVTNPHPEHTDYPAFDAAANRQQGDMPKPGEDFEFTFEEAGTFGYHNHAAPEHTGTITVKE